MWSQVFSSPLRSENMLPSYHPRATQDFPPRCSCASRGASWWSTESPYRRSIEDSMLSTDPCPTYMRRICCWRRGWRKQIFPLLYPGRTILELVCTDVQLRINWNVRSIECNNRKPKNYPKHEQCGIKWLSWSRHYSLASGVTFDSGEKPMMRADSMNCERASSQFE